MTDASVCTAVVTESTGSFSFAFSLTVTVACDSVFGCVSGISAVVCAGSSVSSELSDLFSSAFSLTVTVVCDSVVFGDISVISAVVMIGDIISEQVVVTSHDISPIILVSAAISDFPNAVFSAVLRCSPQLVSSVSSIKMAVISFMG